MTLIVAGRASTQSALAPLKSWSIGPDDWSDGGLCKLQGNLVTPPRWYLADYPWDNYR